MTFLDWAILCWGSCLGHHRKFSASVVSIHLVPVKPQTLPLEVWHQKCFQALPIVTWVVKSVENHWSSLLVLSLRRTSSTTIVFPGIRVWCDLQEPLREIQHLCWFILAVKPKAILYIKICPQALHRSIQCSSKLHALQSKNPSCSDPSTPAYYCVTLDKGISFLCASVSLSVNCG